MSNTRGDGYELWRGRSLVNGEMVGVVVTHLVDAPQNRKVGDMAQAWVLPLDVEPNEAVRSGADESVCGSCRFRPLADGGCYVSVAHTAQRVWWAWRRYGSYQPQRWTAEDHHGKPVRIGAWGDPAAVPLEAWVPLLDRVTGWTAYTHRWRDLAADPDLPGWQLLCMASCDSAADVEEARAAGWRTFRARLASDPLLPREVVCPSAEEATGHGRVTCASCQLCDGVDPGRTTQRKDVAIVVHGFRHRRAARTLGAVGRTTGVAG